MSKPFQSRPLSEELAIVFTPLAVLIATIVPWLSQTRIGGAGQSVFNWLICLVGILLLSVLLGVGFRYYKTHPFVGLLTALALFSLSPASQTAMTSDAWQFLSGLVTLLGGGALPIMFLILSLKTMNQEVENAGSIETASSADTRDSRWIPTSSGNGGSHQVRGVG